MIAEDRNQSLLYNNAGHRNGREVAPSKDLLQITNSKEEIFNDGPLKEEMSAIIKKEEIALGGRRNERIRSIAVFNGLSHRLKDRCKEGQRNGVSLNSPWPS